MWTPWKEEEEGGQTAGHDFVQCSVPGDVNFTERGADVEGNMRQQEHRGRLQGEEKAAVTLTSSYLTWNKQMMLAFFLWLVIPEK